MKLSENPRHADRYLNLRECDGNLVVTGIMSALPGQHFIGPQLSPVEGVSVYSCIAWEPGSGNVTGVSADGSRYDHLAVVASRPVSAVAHSDCMITLFTESERVSIVKDGDAWIRTGDITEFPVAGIRPTGQATVSVAVDRYQFKSSADLRTVPVSATDTAVITGNLLDAYSGLRRKVAGAGRCLMPVFVRYRLLDSNGNLLYLSNPQLIAADNRSRLGVSLPIDIASPAMEQFNMAAESFGIAIHLPEDQSAAIASVMIVETTPEIDMIDFGSQASVSVSRDASGQYKLTVGMPFLSDSLYSAVLSGAIDSLERLFVPVARITEPFCHGERTVTVRAATDVATSSYALQASRIRESVLSVHEVDRGVLQLVSVPNSFTARHSAVSGPATIYAGVSAIRFNGYGAGSFALSVSNEPWRSAVTVKFAGGDSQVVAVSEGSGNAPVTLAPLLCYPSDDAVEMTVALSRGEKNYRRTFKLTHATGSRLSFYLSDSLAPITFEGYETPAFIVPAADALPVPLPGVILAAPTSDQLNPVSSLQIGSGDVAAVVSADGNRSGWDNSRSRFIVFGSDGIYKAVVDASGTIAAAGLIGRSVVRSAGAVAEIPAYGIVAVDCRGELIRISGVSVTSLGRTGGEIIAYDASCSELLLFEKGGNGTALVMDMATQRFASRTVSGFPTSVINSGDGSVIAVKNIIYDVSCATTDWIVPVMLTVETPVSSTAPAGVVRSRGMRRLLSIDLDVKSEQMAGMDVEVFAGVEAVERMARFSISSGSIVSPLLLNVASRRVNMVTVTLSGGMIPGSVFRSITVNRKSL